MTNSSILVFQLALHQWADVSQIIAGAMSVVILFTAVLLFFQVKQQANDSRSELIATTTNLITSVGQAFIAYPEMRRYF